MAYLTKTPFLLRWLYPQLVWRKGAGNKMLYLTFDDGPVPEATPLVLDILAARDIKATFFCVGDNVRKHPHIFQELIKSGHTIGNHTFNHLNGWKNKNSHYIENVERCSTEFRKYRLESTLFRPPYGKIKYRQIKILKPAYSIIMWDVLSGDFDQSLTPEKCLEKAIKATTDGAIIVFHDNIKALDKLKFTLPAYLDHFIEKGYKFSPL